MEKYYIINNKGSHEYTVTILSNHVLKYDGEKHTGKLITLYPSENANPSWNIPFDEPLQQILDTGNGIIFLHKKFSKNVEHQYDDIEYLDIILQISKYPKKEYDNFKIISEKDIHKL